MQTWNDSITIYIMIMIYYIGSYRHTDVVSWGFIPPLELSVRPHRTSGFCYRESLEPYQLSGGMGEWFRSDSPSGDFHEHLVVLARQSPTPHHLHLMKCVRGSTRFFILHRSPPSLLRPRARRTWEFAAKRSRVGVRAAPDDAPASGTSLQGSACGREIG